MYGLVRTVNARLLLPWLATGAPAGGRAHYPSDAAVLGGRLGVEIGRCEAAIVP